MHELRTQPIQQTDIVEDRPGRITVAREDCSSAIPQSQGQPLGLLLATGKDPLERGREINQILVRILLMVGAVELGKRDVEGGRCHPFALHVRFVDERSDGLERSGVLLVQPDGATDEVREPRNSVMYGFMRLTSVVMPLTSNSE